MLPPPGEAPSQEDSPPRRKDWRNPSPSLLGWTRVCTQSMSWELSLTLRMAESGPEPRKTGICCSRDQAARQVTEVLPAPPPKHRLLEECETFL